MSVWANTVPAEQLCLTSTVGSLGVASQIMFASEGFTFEKLAGDSEHVSSCKDSPKSHSRSLLYRKPVRGLQGNWSISCSKDLALAVTRHLLAGVSSWMVTVRGASLQTVQKHASVGWSWLGRPDVAQGFYLTCLALALLWLPGPGEDGTAALLTQRAFSVAWLNLSISNFCVSGIAAFQQGRCTGLTGIRQRFSKQAAQAALWFRRWWGDCHPACAEGECMKKVRHPLVWAITDSESLALQLQLYFFF